MTKPSYLQCVAELFAVNPGIWIDGMSIATVGGCYAYRTRISDCRRVLNMNIENRQRKVGARIVSEYRYVPPVVSSLRELWS